MELDFTQDDRDQHCPIINFDNGYTVIATNENGEQFFEGNIYRYKRSRAEGNVHIVCLDHLHVMKVSKMTKEYKDALPEDIAAEMCNFLGVLPGNIAATGQKVSFLANNKNDKLYQPIMNGAKLETIKKLINQVALLDEQGINSKIFDVSNKL